MMNGQISKEDIMRLLESEEGKRIVAKMMGEGNSDKAVGGGHIMENPDGTKSLMSGPSHEAYLEQGSTDPTGLIGDGSEPGDVFVDKSAQDYTGPLTDSEFDVRSVETGADPMAIEESDINSLGIGARGLDTPAERRFNNDLRRGKLEGSEAFELIESLGIGARGLETPAEREERMKKALTGRQ
jgi:hypothetical protein